MGKSRLPDERLENRLGEYKPAFNELEAITEAERCINCYDAPCISACPTRINIPQFISRIASQNVLGAAKTILQANIFGESCGSVCPTEVLCEGACVYHRLNKKPIGIGKLQQFAVRSSYQANQTFFEPGPASGKKVALLGAGPASIACAHELRVLGHETVIFEKGSLPGGLNTSAIAPYKMKAHVSLEEIERISSIGIEYRFNQELGVQVNLAQLVQEYDAVFLGIGLGPDQHLELSGISNPEFDRKIYGAVELISFLKTLSPEALAKKLPPHWLSQTHGALVIGGGNTALDACRELKQLGIPKVVMSYRRSEVEMSGYAHELAHAREEGVETLFNTLPFELKAVGSRLSVQLQQTRTNALGKVESTGQVFSLETDLIVLATGQAKLENLLATFPGLSFQKGQLVTDSDTGQTGNPKVFAGGDLANGGMEVVNAVAEGKRAARGIHQFLQHTHAVFTEESTHV